ncbi:MAG: glycosyltransferase family 4 protein [Kiritimatiellia bacterium]|jgi:glycosyltransferase involved in cell wall biosynthesis
MRILLVSGIGRLGGAERSLLDWSGAAQGVRFHAAVPPGDLAEAFVRRSVPVDSLPTLRLHRFRGNPFRLAADLSRLARAIAVLRRALRRAPADRIVANSLPAALAAVLASAGKPPVVWHVRDLRFPAGAARFAARRCTHLVAISRAVDARLREALPVGWHSRISCIPNGIDFGDLDSRRTDRATARSALGLPADARIVGMLAQSVPWKRHDLFLAMALRLAGRHPGLRFAIAGAGTEALSVPGALRPRLATLGDVDGIAFLQAVDILVHPAEDEPFGRCLCEAIALGTPVVAVDSAGPSEIVASAGAGILVPPSDAVPESLASAVDRLLEDAPSHTEAIAEAQKRVRTIFDARRVATSMLALLRGDTVAGESATAPQNPPHPSGKPQQGIFPWPDPPSP